MVHMPNPSCANRKVVVRSFRSKAHCRKSTTKELEEIEDDPEKYMPKDLLYCNYCSKIWGKDNIYEHVQKFCLKRPFFGKDTCPSCGRPFAVGHIEQHVRECKRNDFGTETFSGTLLSCYSSRYRNKSFDQYQHDELFFQVRGRKDTAAYRFVGQLTL